MSHNDDAKEDFILSLLPGMILLVLTYPIWKPIDAARTWWKKRRAAAKETP